MTNKGVIDSPMLLLFVAMFYDYQLGLPGSKPDGQESSATLSRSNSHKQQLSLQ